MHDLYRTFASDLYALEKRAYLLFGERNGHGEPWRSKYLTESILSDLWQRWGRFSREIVLASCQGSKSRSGVAIAARAVPDNSWQRIGFEAKQAARNVVPNATGVNSFIRQEPTWGDPDTMISILTVTAPTNVAALLSAFGLPIRGVKHLQIVRNACAHTNAESIKTVRGLYRFYQAEKEVGPICNFAWRLEPTRRRPALVQWIEEMQIVADVATN